MRKASIMRKYMYQIFDHMAGELVHGMQFTTKADARRMRNTMNALEGKHPIHMPTARVPIPAVEMRYTVSRIELVADVH